MQVYITAHEYRYFLSGAVALAYRQVPSYAQDDTQYRSILIMQHELIDDLQNNRVLVKKLL